jgi:hypothetical protein
MPPPARIKATGDCWAHEQEDRIERGHGLSGRHPGALLSVSRTVSRQGEQDDAKPNFALNARAILLAPRELNLLCRVAHLALK